MTDSDDRRATSNAMRWASPERESGWIQNMELCRDSLSSEFASEVIWLFEACNNFFAISKNEFHARRHWRPTEQQYFY
jgi:hypothetical protein